MSLKTPQIAGLLALVLGACGVAEQPADGDAAGADQGGAALDTAMDTADDASLFDTGGDEADTAPHDLGPADVPAPCPFACTETVPRCIDGRPHVCKDLDGDGCWTFSAGPACGAGKVCEEGVCTSGHCGPGTVRKDGVCVVKGCPIGEVKIDGKCLKDPCGKGTTWLDGTCQAPCPKVCTLAEKRCENGFRQVCLAVGGEQCPSWVSQGGCPLGSFCYGGDCTTGDSAIVEPIVSAGGAQHTTVVIAPSDPRVVYAGTERSGVYVSGDGGTTWGPANSGFWRRGDYAIAALDVHPQRSWDVVAAVGATSDHKGAVYRTRDGGLHWLLASKLPCFEARGVHRVVGKLFARDPANANIVYVASAKCGLFRSNNGGSSWIYRALPGVLLSGIYADPKLPGKFVLTALDDPYTKAIGGIWTGFNTAWKKRTYHSVRTMVWWKKSWFAGSVNGVHKVNDVYSFSQHWPKKACSIKNAVAPDVRALAVFGSGLSIGTADLPKGATTCDAETVTGGLYEQDQPLEVGLGPQKRFSTGGITGLVAAGPTALMASGNGVWRRSKGKWSSVNKGTAGGNWADVTFDAKGNAIGGGADGHVWKSAQTNAVKGPDCDGMRYRGRCFKAFDSSAKWLSAQSSCKGWGGDLATIQSPAENAFARSYVSHECGNVDAWIGLSDAATEGVFEWADDAERGWRGWLPGQPANSGMLGEHFTELRRDSWWNDLNVNTTRNCMLCAKGQGTVGEAKSVGDFEPKCAGAVIRRVAASGSVLVVGRPAGKAAKPYSCEQVVLLGADNGKDVVWEPGLYVHDAASVAGTKTLRVLAGTTLYEGDFSANPGWKKVGTSAPGTSPNLQGGVHIVALAKETHVFGSFRYDIVKSGQTKSQLDVIVMKQVGVSPVTWDVHEDALPLAFAGLESSVGKKLLRRVVLRDDPTAKWQVFSSPDPTRWVRAIARSSQLGDVLAVVDEGYFVPTATVPGLRRQVYAMRKGQKHWLPVHIDGAQGECTEIANGPAGGFVLHGPWCAPAWVRLL